MPDSELICLAVAHVLLDCPTTESDSSGCQGGDCKKSVTFYPQEPSLTPCAETGLTGPPTGPPTGPGPESGSLGSTKLAVRRPLGHFVPTQLLQRMQQLAHRFAGRRGWAFAPRSQELVSK
jgi:hypothetical protein